MIDVLIMHNGLRNVQLLKLYVHASSQVIMNNPAAFTAGCHSLALLRFYSRFISRVTCIYIRMEQIQRGMLLCMLQDTLRLTL